MRGGGGAVVRLFIFILWVAGVVFNFVGVLFVINYKLN